MGFWSTELYGNDTTADVRDTYIEFLYKGLSDEKASDATINEFHTLIGTEEEDLLWYALADTQWRLGRLLPSVKINALNFINAHAGVCDELDFTEKTKWNDLLQALANQLDLKMPTRKELAPMKTFERNPWDVGDIYAYLFHSTRSKKEGLYGKYIVFQKIGEALSYGGLRFSVIQIFNKVFTSCPTMFELGDTDILPLVYPPDIEGMPECVAEYVPSFEWFTKAIMILDKPSDFPRKHFFFVGKTETQYKQYSGNECQEMYWGKKVMEEWIIDYYLKWKDKTVDL